MIKNLVIIISVFTILFGKCLYAEDSVRVELKANPSKTNVAKGEKFSVRLTMTFFSEWYTYDIKEQVGKEGIGPTTTEISAAPADALEISGSIITPKPHSKFDEGFQMDIKYFKGTESFEIPVIAKRDIDFAKDTVYIVSYMQLCNSTACLPPDEYKAAISTVTYKPEEVAVTTESSGDDFSKAKEQGIFSFLWISMSAGALALLTPCVFPMVPITVSFFTNRATKKKSRSLRDALVYAIGIIVTFTSLGVFFSLVFGATGIQEFAKNPYVYLFIAGIFVFFALNLFGVYEINIPSGLLNKLNAKSQDGEGIVSVILMGLTFSLASFSCTGPLVGAALISAASGEWFYPIISMLAFSTVLALPFFLLALFPTALTSLPRAGGWMNNIKVVLGFVVIAVSMKFINDALAGWDSGISRELFLALWIAIFTLTTLYILGLYKMPHDSPVDKVGVVRLLFALIFGTLTFYLMFGIAGRPLGELETYLPQAEYTAAASMVPGRATAANAHADWFEDYNLALAEAKKQGKNIFLDFSGVSCTNCKKMERKIFPLSQISELMSGYVKVKLITDKPGEPYSTYKKMQLERFNSVAQPLYVIMTPDEQALATAVYTPNENEFAEFLKKGVK